MAVVNGRYKLERDFSLYNEMVVEYIESVYLKSLLFYKDNYHLVNVTNTRNLNIRVIDNAMSYLEEYLNYIYLLDKDNFLDNFNYFKDKLKVVTVLPKNKRGLYGRFESEMGAIFINPELKKSQFLSSDERIRLYIYHELGHLINSRWMDKAVGLINNIDRGGYIANRQLIYDGCSLLDEAIVQDRAEELAYMIGGKERPKKRLVSNAMFGGVGYKTNFDFYGELQEVAIVFGRTLRGIGKYKEDSSVMFDLCNRAIGDSFMDEVFEEYERDGHINDLYLMLTSMGVIKNASYANFGYGDKVYLNESKKALKEFNRIAKPLRDYREPYTDVSNRRR